MTSRSLSGRRVLVTAGPTWVFLDAVRHIGNLSSGRTGLDIARALAESGAAVTLLLGPGRVQPTAEDRERMEVVPFVTFDDLHGLVRERVGSRGYDALIHAAAVSDYRPVEEAPGKLPSGEEELVLRLRRTPKIVDEVKGLDPGIFLVKFKLEVGRSEAELLEIARESGSRSRAALVVANDLTQIGQERHVAYLVDGPRVRRCETTSELAGALVDELAGRLAGRSADENRGVARDGAAAVGPGGRAGAGARRPGSRR